MFTATINRYQSGRNETITLEIPSRVTITGKEDHFDRAYEDARMAVAGMMAADAVTCLADEDRPIYRITRIEGR